MIGDVAVVVAVVVVVVVVVESPQYDLPSELNIFSNFSKCSTGLDLHAEVFSLSKETLQSRLVDCDL